MRSDIVDMPLSVRDVRLLDLTRVLFMQTPVPIQHMREETDSLFRALQDHADGLGDGVADEVLLDACETFGRAQARATAARYAGTISCEERERADG